MNEKKTLAKSYQYDNVEEKWLERWTEAGSFSAKMEEGETILFRCYSTS